MLRAPASLNSASGPGLHGYYSRSFIRSTKVASALPLPSGHRQLSCPGFGTPRLQGLPHGARVQAELVPAPGEPGPGAGCGSTLPPGSFQQSSSEEQGTSSSGGARVGTRSQGAAEVASLSVALLQPAVLRPGLDLGFGSRLLPERLLPRAWLVALQQQPSAEASPGPCSRGR